MLALVETVATAQSITNMFFDDNENQRPDDTSVDWIRATVRHRVGDRSSLARKDGGSKHRQTGFLNIEIFTTYGDGLVKSDTLSNAFATALRASTDSDIWFRRISEIEVGQDGGWYKSDVLAEFEYELIVD